MLREHKRTSGQNSTAIQRTLLKGVRKYLIWTRIPKRSPHPCRALRPPALRTALRERSCQSPPPLCRSTNRVRLCARPVCAEFALCTRRPRLLRDRHDDDEFETGPTLKDTCWPVSFAGPHAPALRIFCPAVSRAGLNHSRGPGAISPRSRRAESFGATHGRAGHHHSPSPLARASTNGGGSEWPGKRGGRVLGSANGGCRLRANQSGAEAG